MNVPVDIAFRNVPRHPDLEALVHRKVAHLERFCDHISSCRVLVERSHTRGHSPGPYEVRIDLTVPPSHELAVSRNPQDRDQNDLEAVIQNAFDAAERRLKRLVDRQRGAVKAHDEPRALVIRLFREEGYGFLQALDGREIYFHRNSVAGDEFDALREGMEVRFVEVAGEDGPQASTVQTVATPG